MKLTDSYNMSCGNMYLLYEAYPWHGTIIVQIGFIWKQMIPIKAYRIYKEKDVPSSVSLVIKEDNITAKDMLWDVIDNIEDYEIFELSKAESLNMVAEVI